MNVYWLEQRAEAVPTGNAWFSPAELRRLHDLRFPKRRDDWRLGRWTAKCAVAHFRHATHDDVLRDIEIWAEPSGAPQVSFGGAASLTISISHRAGRAVCAVAEGDVRLGCDVEWIEPHSDAFLEDYFTAEEQDFVRKTSAQDQLRTISLLWSAKESALKALKEGLRLDTRSVAVSVSPPAKANAWNPLSVQSNNGALFHGWWRERNGAIYTVVSDPFPNIPVALTPAIAVEAEDIEASCGRLNPASSDTCRTPEQSILIEGLPRTRMLEKGASLPPPPFSVPASYR